MKRPGILQKKAQQIQQQQAPSNKARDSQYLTEASNVFKELSGGVSGAKPFLNMGFMTGYFLETQDDKQNKKTYIAFVFANGGDPRVIDFLVKAAKSDSMNGLVGNTAHVYLCKEYKLKGGM